MEVSSHIQLTLFLPFSLFRSSTVFASIHKSHINQQKPQSHLIIFEASPKFKSRKVRAQPKMWQLEVEVGLGTEYDLNGLEIEFTLTENSFDVLLRSFPIFLEIKVEMVIKQREKASVFGKETHSTLFFLRTLLCSVPICILPIGPELEAEAHSYSSQQKKKRFQDAQAQGVLPWLPPNPAPASYPPRTRSNGHSNIRLEVRSSPSDRCSSGPRAESTVYPHGL